jgi:hypothetical protein
MICNDCMDVAWWNRKEHDESPDEPEYYLHPEDCGCDCQHQDPREWDAMYAVERPDVS